MPGPSSGGFLKKLKGGDVLGGLTKLKKILHKRTSFKRKVRKDLFKLEEILLTPPEDRNY